VKFKKSR